MDLQDPQGPMENREIQARTGKLVKQVLKGPLGVRAALDPKERREIVERVSQDRGVLRDYRALQGLALGIDLLSWTWRDLDLQIWTNSGVPVVHLAPQAHLVLPGDQ